MWANDGGPSRWIVNVVFRWKGALMRIFAIAAWPLLLVVMEHVCVADEPVRINWSGATQSYECDTGLLFGCIDPYSHYHGVVGLMHREYQVDVIRPRKAFLNAEYYRKPGVERRMLPRQLSLEEKTTHGLREGEVIVRFPEEPVYGFAMELSYRPHDDAVDMRVEILPSRDVPQFEIFFASYVCEAFSETWTPLEDKDGQQQWKKLDNREVINEAFRVFGHVADHAQPSGNRSNNGQQRGLRWKTEDLPFKKPILIARNPGNGLAVVFLCDPNATTSLAGQYHGWDTAHDWWFGADLVAGQPTTASARMIYRRFRDLSSMFTDVEKEWSDFVERLAQ
jgi:hypothetical protein